VVYALDALTASHRLPPKTLAWLLGALHPESMLWIRSQRETRLSVIDSIAMIAEMVVTGVIYIVVDIILV
jgi:hypothetical protein